MIANHSLVLRETRLCKFHSTSWMMIYRYIWKKRVKWTNDLWRMGMKIYCCVYYQDMMTDEISKIKYIFQIKHKNVICSLLDVSEIKYYFNVIPGKRIKSLLKYHSLFLNMLFEWMLLFKIDCMTVQILEKNFWRLLHITMLLHEVGLIPGNGTVDEVTRIRVSFFTWPHFIWYKFKKNENN